MTSRSEGPVVRVCFEHGIDTIVSFTRIEQCPVCLLKQDYARLDRTYQQLLDEVRSLNVNEL